MKKLTILLNQPDSRTLVSTALAMEVTPERLVMFGVSLVRKFYLYDDELSRQQLEHCASDGKNLAKSKAHIKHSTVKSP